MNTKHVVIAGAGVMGASLAQVYAQAGCHTTLYDISPQAIQKGRHLVGLNQEVLVREGMISADASRQLLGNIAYTTDTACFAGCQLLVESIVERMEPKQAFWQQASALAPESALLATNTSGLSITQLAKSVRHPGRFMGQHWLNPPHLLPLCELVVGEQTDAETVEAMRSLVLALGKQPVVVQDIRGFITNRIQFAVLREALHIVQSGAATVEDVDTVLKAGMGLRYSVLGPFGVADFGGLDTFDQINSYLNAELSNQAEGNALLRAKVEAGKLGVKSGAGFYDYSGDKADQAIRERDRQYIQLAKLLYFDQD